MTKTLSDTIVAISTPRGKGGIGVVRVSGPLASEIALKILNVQPKPRSVHYGFFYDEQETKLDQGIALFFKAPNSFTGEDVLELQGHGSPVVLNSLIKTILQYGARLARPGEFSERAFLNNKIDLSQAEAIADLINASSERAARSALSSLEGKFSRHIQILIDRLIELRAYLEASIDFSEDEIDFLESGQVRERLKETLDEIQKIYQSATQGALLREGMRLVIAGKPNVGKSSLLNCLSGRESSIVTDIAGTTRDVIHETLDIDGLPIHILDTAGLQETDNPIEKEGIRRTWKEIEKADHILLVVDSTLSSATDLTQLWPEFSESHFSKTPITVIKNKIDLLPREAPRIEKQDNVTFIYLSAKTEEGLPLLREHLKELIGFEETGEEVILARQRHLESLKTAEGYLMKGSDQLEKEGSVELSAEDLRQAQLALSEITGAFTSEDLLDKIFSTFCIGK